MIRKIGYKNYETVSNIDDIGMNRLASAYADTVVERRAKDLRRDEEFDIPHTPHIEAIKKKLAEEINKISENTSGYLPVTSIFDALQLVKAKKDFSKNAGLRALGGHLETMWKSNRTADLDSQSFIEMREYYARNYPKAGMNEVFEEISDKGYFTLPLANLMSIAASIRTQEDFDDAMVENGLHGNEPMQIKARKFILAALNGKEAQEESYEVIVGNIGTVLETSNSDEAYETYAEYVDQSKSNYGRAAGEDVTLFVNGDILEEYYGTSSEEEDFDRDASRKSKRVKAQSDTKDFFGGSFHIVTDGVEVGWGVEMNDTPVIVAVVHDGSGFTPGAAVYIAQDYGSEDAALQEAYDLLETVTRDNMTPEDWTRLEEDAEGYGMDSQELMTETFNGFVATMTPQELKEAVDNAMKYNKEKLEAAITFEEPEEEDFED